MADQSQFPFGEYDLEVMKLLLIEANADTHIAGFVYPDDPARARLPIFEDGQLVGFATPRQDKDGVWRMGAIFIKPEFRGHGLGSGAIRDFMSERRGRAFIEEENASSERAYEKAGFRRKHKVVDDKGWWWENFGFEGKGEG